MRILFQDGWPNLYPKVFVDGIVSEHANAKGEVCLWRPGDMSFQWLTWDGVKARIAEWCERARQGFGARDLVLDAHLYYEPKARLMVLVDLKTLKAKPFTNGESGEFSWTPKKPDLVIINGAKQGAEMLPGRWYFRSHIPVPPRNFETFRQALTSAQQKNFDRGIKAVESGGQDAQILFALLWPTARGLNVQLVRAHKDGNGGLATEALEAAPNDHDTLRLRAGPDAAALSHQRAVLFGAGAIGSHAVLLLAEMGLGSLMVCDQERLRPGNAVRHVAGQTLVGYPKVVTVEYVVREHAPWVTVKTTPDNPWDPRKLTELIAGMNLVLDTTGLASFTDQLSRLAEQAKVSLVSAALFRGGAVGRVRRQVVGKDVPAYQRHEQRDRYPAIPPGQGEEEIAGLEAGCSAPVVNASPAVVQAVASLMARVVADMVSCRFELSEECIEVYSPLETVPFNSLGLLLLGKRP